MGQARPGPVHDLVALAEIELCGELIIAASATAADRLSLARIDEVLRVDEEPGEGEGPRPDRGTGGSANARRGR